MRGWSDELGGVCDVRSWYSKYNVDASCRWLARLRGQRDILSVQLVEST